MVFPLTSTSSRYIQENGCWRIAHNFNLLNFHAEYLILRTVKDVIPLTFDIPCPVVGVIHLFSLKKDHIKTTGS
jgi:hypothetical protein